MKTIGSVAEARLIIWERLAVTAREDGRNVDWADDEPDGEGYDEPAVRRLIKASKDVAISIDKRVATARRKRATRTA